ncbi:electron transfer flavoprotein alpha subunit apoprotein [Chthonomonas calidirosea]|uniref:electron transfer flavoprotein subunit alpha/FixB family protein n=1 Tax=Chthonomonas calidirosea TaxID=454171 RepID=UPI0006DD554E|nr:FAD-binding protein [Chthonomonas calidirosea]CEK13656.1 electron transfer flavoprotein alpha subunit apoprotein [Chthonomonas calidirosea]CEK13657.1 electron transfer flavoprotein alpha subunit apoprotein [Chthonomonas calidirosea]
MTKWIVLADTNGETVLQTTLSAIGFVQQFAPNNFSLLIIGGTTVLDALEPWRRYGAEKLLIGSLTELAHPTADKVAPIVVKAMQSEGASWLVGPASSFGRDLLPRVAGLLDLPMLSEIIRAERDEAGFLFQRPAYAGNLIETYRPVANRGILSIRTSAFYAATTDSLSPVEILQLDPSELPTSTRWIGQEKSHKQRPELSSARVVVSGGRPLKDAETFERLIGGLADRLGGAVGATRAAVDSGIAPNELQIGQTGRVVAPDLYIAVGISGSVQHLAGMKDSKVIVAINNDPNAPIFEVADYGLVADLYQAVPELLEKL